MLVFGAPDGGAGVGVGSDRRGASSRVPAYGWHLVSLTCADISAAPTSSSGGSDALLTNAAAAKMRFACAVRGAAAAFASIAKCAVSGTLNE